MASRLTILIDLLHSPGEMSLATHSVTLPGFPFVTAVPFATDEHHRPVMLLSRLAEHTKNLLDDSRTSVLMAKTFGGGEMARVTMLGTIVEFEPHSEMTARYLRVHPEAERFMQLGDFRFFRMDPVRIRVVGGFAQAGWLEGQQLLDAPHISLEDEAKLLEEIRGRLPADVELLGVDAYGADYRKGDYRQRLEFKAGPVVGDAVLPALRCALKGLH